MAGALIGPSCAVEPPTFCFSPSLSLLLTPSPSLSLSLSLVGKAISMRGKLHNVLSLGGPMRRMLDARYYYSKLLHIKHTPRGH